MGNQRVFPEWTWIIGFWIGAAIGSFLNVVIYRLPRGLSVSKPKHSFCPSCNKQLTPGELIPLLSWLLQKGRCSCGKNAVPPRYFFVELITGTLFAIIWYQQLYVGPGPEAFEQANPVKAVGFMLMAAALVAAIFTDLAHYIIPDQVNAAMLVIGVGMNVAYAVMGNPVAFSGGIPSSILGALTGIGVLWGIAFLGRILFRKDAMGHGDIKMARGIGAVLLPVGAMISFGLAVALGAVLGLILVAVRAQQIKKLEAKKQAEYEAAVAQAKAEGLPVPPAPSEEEEPDFPPESIGSLLWCGLGYVLCIDIIGLYIPSLYERWFGENPYSVEEIDDDAGVELTTIPFGPYLALGAIGVMLFEPRLLAMVNDYWSALQG